uniref:Nucleotide-diphospho-sugar transferase domain-containing protein n=1 Tax=Chromera velia CCMP2878 TaxID=1169474 RepID=A0A0G4GD06_9ALVE|eukprot:Cvel_21253.t1-p1 / transcript=Cvel_21253.t1 / gene=Cvel_21253 / organism=Chromera_velia_CCMP2878 / gene_product=hypothetical protein / transcript_product=hypothetical protein / location=Cvel_scaffold1977:9773-11089(-) / protein_length=439 / sequence_SO=supercontig / SO=protein_coding / is_pseudo=false
MAMAMLWDVSRSTGGLECVDHSPVVWGVQWSAFMSDYLSLAKDLGRNLETGLPPSLPVPRGFRPQVKARREGFRIGVVTLCQYPKESALVRVSRAHREAYCDLHGYANLFHERFDDGREDTKGRHPVWGGVALALRYLEEGEYDWVFSIDCDSLVVDLETTVEHLIFKYAGDPLSALSVGKEDLGRSGVEEMKLELDDEVHLIISEDGRGLAGGNWLIRRSDWSISFLRSVLGPSGDLMSLNPFDRHNLKDQFSLLWHIVVPETLRAVVEKLTPGVDRARSALEGKTRKEKGGGDEVHQSMSRQNFTTQASSTPLGRVKKPSELFYVPQVRLASQSDLNAYPWAFCRPEHLCFEEGRDTTVSFPTLSRYSEEMVEHFLQSFWAISRRSLKPLEGRGSPREGKKERGGSAGCRENGSTRSIPEENQTQMRSGCTDLEQMS